MGVYIYVLAGCRQLLYDSGYIAASIYSTPEESISSAVDTFASAALRVCSLVACLICSPGAPATLMLPMLLYSTLAGPLHVYCW